MNRIIIYITLLLSSFSLNAQQALTLEQAISTGLSNNFDIKLAAYGADIAEISNSWGFAGALPNISASIQQPPLQRSWSVEEDTTVIFTNISPSINMNWTIFNGFSAYITKQRLDLLEQQAEGFSAIAVENVLQGIILAYYNALLQQEKLNVLQELMGLSRDRFQQVQLRQELGVSVTFDLLQAKNSYLSDSANFVLQQLNFDNAIRNLNLLLAANVNAKYTLVDKFEYEFQDFSLEELKSKMLASNKTLQNQYINNEILQKDKSLAVSSLYPVVSLNTGIAQSNTNTNIQIAGLPELSGSSSSLNYYIGFTISMSLFNGGNRINALRIAKIKEQIDLVETEQIEFNLLNRLISMYELFLAQQQVVNVNTENMEASKLNMEIATEKYKLGVLDLFNYRDIQLIYMNASISRLQSVYNLINTYTELLRLTGGVVTEN